MIIGISGAQGQGKTTLIKDLLYFNGDKSIISTNIQTARSLLKELNTTLDDINRNVDKKIKFQEALLKRHHFELSMLQHMKETYLVERTFADIFAYALVSVGPFNEYDDWVNSYYDNCLAAQQAVFDNVILLSGRDYTPEEDGVRSVNVHFSKLVDELIIKYTHEFSKKSSGVWRVSCSDRAERVAYVNSQLVMDKAVSKR